MKYLYGLLLFALLILQQIQKPEIDFYSISFVLGALCLFILDERYVTFKYFSIVYALGLLLLSFYESSFIILFGIPLFRLTYKKQYYTLVLVLMMTVVQIVEYRYDAYIFHFIVGIIWGFVLGVKDEKEKSFIAIIDKERRLRYQLELTQNELLNSKKEIEHLAEMRERNRIAHELHDNLGHSIAGVLFQLRAALTVVDKDRERVKAMLLLCTEKLTEALEMTRNTVYRIKTQKTVGIGNIQNVIDDFKYCEVVFTHTGDFNKVSAYIIKILESNIKEALTNAAKHSGATCIQLNIEVRRRNIRLYYKDNGKGCPNITQSVGIAGIRARVLDVGGTVSMDGSDGFLMVCNVPNFEDN